MAVMSVRRVRDAFGKAEVTDEAKGLELATDLDEALSEKLMHDGTARDTRGATRRQV